MIEVDIRPVGRGVACIARSGETRGCVIWIGRAVPIRLVTSETGCRQSRVVVVGVALRARDRRVSPREWKYRRVIEARRAPAAGGVTEGAVGWESGCGVIRIRRASEIGLMAGVAGRGCVCVVVVGMALGTRKGRVHARKRVVGELGVIEGNGCPARCVVARFAGSRERGSRMVRIGGGGPVLSMAAIAVSGKRQVVVVHVALCAGHRRVGTREREY